MFQTTVVITGLSGGPYYSSFTFQGETQGVADAAIAAVEDFWVAGRNYIKSGSLISCDGVSTIINSSTGQPTGLLQSTAWSTSGLDTGQPLPPATQGLVRWRTGVFVGGREIRGRTFLPGVTETYSTTGQPDSAYTSAWATAAAALVADAGCELAVWSRAHQQVATVTASNVWTSNFAVLRSRRD